MTDFRVVDCRTLVVTDAVTVRADTPEHAARVALGENLVRGGHSKQALRARVYFKDKDRLSMVRLYSKADH